MIELRALIYALAFGGILYWMLGPKKAFGAIPPQSRKQHFVQPHKMSVQGLNQLKKFEGLRLTAYKDQGGHWTIGYGHKIVSGDGLSPSSIIGPEKATQLLARDLSTAEEAVRSSISVPLTQSQFDALVSLAYNIGAGAFRGSTLRRLLNAEDYRGAANEFRRWKFAGGKVSSGLMARREKEARMFGSA